MKQPVRVLPPDVFDTLELSALVFGGIGSVFRFDERNDVPCCIWGHAEFLDTDDPDSACYNVVGPVTNALLSAFRPALPWLAADDAAIEHNDHDNRISFSEWCKRLNVIRGGHTA